MFGLRICEISSVVVKITQPVWLRNFDHRQRQSICSEMN